jgi:hypothetical protein
VLRLQTTGFSLPKEGEGDEDNWDAIALSPDSLVAAVADGATRSFHGGIWAKILVHDFVRDPALWLSGDTRPETLARARERWQCQVDQRLKAKFGDDYPFWIERGLEEGAGATLLGVAFQSSGEDGPLGVRCAVLALGDSCLFHVRGDVLLRSLPLTCPENFSDLPMLWLSVARRPDALPEAFEVDCQPGDLICLASDSLAAWILGQSAQDHSCTWARLSTIRYPDEFAEFVRNERAHGLLKDDDTTLLVLEVLGDAPNQ